MVKTPVPAMEVFEAMRSRVCAAYELHSPLVIRAAISMPFDHPYPCPCQRRVYPAQATRPEEEAPLHRAPPHRSGAAYRAANVDPSRSGTSRCTPVPAIPRVQPCTARAAQRPTSRMTRIWVETVRPRPCQRQRRRWPRDGTVSGDGAVSISMAPGWCRSGIQARGA